MNVKVSMEDFFRRSALDQCTCPPSFQRGAGHCLFLRKIIQNYTDAEAACAKNGGLLFSPRNNKENQAAANLAGRSTNVWLGYRTRPAENLTISSDGRPATYTNWGPGEPDMNSNGCVWIYNGLCGDAWCYHKFMSLCDLPQYYRSCCPDKQ